MQSQSGNSASNERNDDKMGRPSRSDEHLLPEEEARIEAEARGYFDDMAPKRHTKPSRSDPDALLHVLPSVAATPIPELCKFQDLEAHSQKIACESDGSKPTEEYMATDYYDDINCMDKHHHTTGSGFIKMEEANSNSNSNTKGRCFEIAADPDVNAWNRHASDSSSGSGTGKGNPATNDWIPSAQTHTVILASSKPKRSDN